MNNMRTESWGILFPRKTVFHAIATAWVILSRFGWKRLLKRVRLKYLQYRVGKCRPADYAKWIFPSPRQLARQRELSLRMKGKYRFLIFFSADGCKPGELRSLHRSLMRQSFPEWILAVAGCPCPEPLEKTEYLSGDSGFPSPDAAARFQCTHLIFVQSGTELSPDALFEFSDCWNRCPDAALVYSDEAYFKSEIENPFQYHFKPDFSPVTLLSTDYIGLSWAVSAEAFSQSASRMAERPSASAASEIIFCLHENGLHIGHIPKPLFGYRRNNADRDQILLPPSCPEAEIRIRHSHLQKLSIAGTVDRLEPYPFFRIRYQLKEHPLVSIMIPNRDHAGLLRRCIDSVLQRSSYRNFEIVILENSSTAQETEEYYSELEKIPEVTLARYPDDGPFNYSRLNNWGSSFCRGEYIVFMNNDIEVITPDWIEQMLMFAQQDKTGAVGVKLLFPDRTIQHGGVITGFMGAAENAFLRTAPGQPGYAGRLLYARNCAAVTFACCMVPKAVFEKAGRLDEDFSISFNDVDFCLTLHSLGFRIVWTPFAEFVHHESTSRGYDASIEKCVRLQQEIRLLRKKWHSFFLKGDPFHNPNLSLVSTRCDFRHPAENALIRSLLDDLNDD